MRVQNSVDCLDHLKPKIHHFKTIPKVMFAHKYGTPSETNW